MVKKVAIILEIIVFIGCLISDDFWVNFVCTNLIIVAPILFITFLLSLILKINQRDKTSFNGKKIEKIEKGEKVEKIKNFFQDCKQEGTIEDIESIKQLIMDNINLNGSTTEFFELILTIAKIYNYLNDKENTEEYFKKVISTASKLNYQELAQIAQSRFDKKAFYDTIYIYTYIIENNKADKYNIVDAYYNRALAYAELDSIPNKYDAIEDIKNAITEINKGSYPYSPIEADKPFERYLNKYNFKIAQIYKSINKYDYAIKYFNMIFKGDEFYSLAKKEISDIETKKESLKYEQMAESQYNNGVMAYNYNDDEDAISCFEKILICKCATCGTVYPENIIYCKCGSNLFIPIEHKYTSKAREFIKKIKEEQEIELMQSYRQKIHDILALRNQTIVAEENYQLGLNEFNNKNIKKAKEYIKNCLELLPSNQKYKEGLNLIEQEEKRIETQEIAKQAKEQLNLGNANQAIKYFDELIKMYECAEYFYLRGKAYFMQGYLSCDKAIYNFKKAIELEPNNAEYHYYCGKANYEKHHFDEAHGNFSKAINLKNDDWEYYYSRGLVNYELGNYADSIDDYYNSIMLSSDIINDDYKRYKIKNTLDKFENISNNNEKVTYIKALMTKGNEYVDTGCSCLQKNDFEKAIEYFNKAIEINPNYKFAYINRATAYAKLKKYQNAINDYNKVIDLDPHWAEAYQFRSITYYNMNLYDEAISDCNTLIKFNILDAQAYYIRGVVYLMDNVQNLAMKDFVSACIIDKSYINKISESTNINLMSLMNLISNKLPDLLEKETVNIIQIIQKTPDKDLGFQEHSQNNELSNNDISVIKNSTRKIDL